MLSFPHPQTFDILPQIYDLITRLPSSTIPSTIPPHNLPSTITPLDPKDLPQAAVPIKLKIQRAKAAVSALPDVDRTIEEQTDEMRELERRIKRLKGVMADLGRRAGGGEQQGDVGADGKEDENVKEESRVVMEGIEQSRGTM
jgi:RNA polymerase II transcription mediator complex subunit 9